MIYITQLIYVIEGRETVFDQFEAMAIPLIAKYRGKLLLRMRPNVHDLIAGEMEPPYEIHLVEFDSENDFQLFLQDEERKQFLHLKERSIRSSFLVKGAKL